MPPTTPRSFANSVRRSGHVAVIDPNYRADRARKEQWAAVVKRSKLINMPNFDDVIYDFRTMVNAR